MIALAPAPTSLGPRLGGPPDWSARFLKLLPLIRTVARHCFRGMPRDQRADAVREDTANCFVAYARLVQRGRQEFAFATPLALYAVAQYRDGRRVGSCAKRHDVMSPYCQRRNAIVFEAMFQCTDDDQWEELIVEDNRSTPAKLLAGGVGTGAAAKQLRLSAARVSPVSG